jgi:hypothetical protein
VHILLKSGIFGRTPLIQASIVAKVEEVAALLKYGADVNAQTEVYDCLLCVEIYTHTLTHTFPNHWIETSKMENFL